MKRLIFHIGMGKCGSTAIQSWLKMLHTPSIEYITYPGEIDSNPIVDDFLKASAERPQSVVDAISRNSLGCAFHKFIISRIKESISDCIIVSAEHVSWLLDDVETSQLVQRFLLPASAYCNISIIAYFRTSATGRYLSTLQEDAKYNSKIKLYVPDWPYSENYVVFSRWASICNEFNFRWVPVEFNRDVLEGHDVIVDFSHRAMLPSVRSVPLLTANESVSPIWLCAYRGFVGDQLDILPWDRKSELLHKSIKLLGDISEKNAIAMHSAWHFKREIGDYIEAVSVHDKDVVCVNRIVAEAPDSSPIHGAWDPSALERIIPNEMQYIDGYLTGPLQSFLDGIDMSLLEKIETLLRADVLRFFSTYYGEV